MKRCFRCKTEKPPTAFGADRRQKDGRCQECKECRRLYLQDPENRARNAERARLWRAANPERARASVQRSWAEKRDVYLERQRRKWEREKNAYNAKRRASKSDETRRQKREWAKKNKASVAATNRQNYVKNREQHIAQSIAWTKANPERNRLNKNLNYNKRRAGGQVTRRQWLEICLFYGNVCALCKDPERALTIDHYIPIAAGGLNTWDNTWPLCLECNQRKHMKVPAGVPPHVTVLLITTQAKGAQHESSG